jgi:hypothetical protein
MRLDQWTERRPCQCVHRVNNFPRVYLCGLTRLSQFVSDAAALLHIGKAARCPISWHKTPNTSRTYNGRVQSLLGAAHTFYLHQRDALRLHKCTERKWKLEARKRFTLYMCFPGMLVSQRKLFSERIINRTRHLLPGIANAFEEKFARNRSRVSSATFLMNSCV